MTYKIQLINNPNHDYQASESINRVIAFVHDLHQYFVDFPLHKLLIYSDKTVLNANASLYIKPISNKQIKVGFKPVQGYGIPKIDANNHWITITDDSTPDTDATSKFLLFFVGFEVLPFLSCTYSVDLFDACVAMQEGNQGKLINLDAIEHTPTKAVKSFLLWLNDKDATMKKMGAALDRLSNALEAKDVLGYTNMSNCVVLKKTGLVLLVS